jgi:cyclase
MDHGRMPVIPYTAGLHEVARGIYAYLQPDGSWGKSNCGVIDDGGSILLVDTMFTLSLTRDLLDAVAATLPGSSVVGLVNTHPNGDHCWGNQLVQGVPIYGSAATAHGMEHEIPPETMTAMAVTSSPTSAIGIYQRRFFGDFDFSGITLTPPTHTFTGSTSIAVGGRTVDVFEVGPAHSDGDSIIVVDDVVFAGDILFVGDHPVMWSGPISNWVAACDRIIATGARVIVPGHGPVTDLDGVRRFRHYLEDIDAQAAAQFAAGTPYDVAAATMNLDDYHDWGHPERLILTVGAIYRSLGHDPGSRAVLINRMAEHHWTLPWVGAAFP